MKRIVQILVAVMAVVILANCAKKGPEAVAEKFLKHLNKQEWEECKKLGTEDTKKMISFFETMPAEENEAKDVEIKDMKCTEDGDKATCTYKIDDEDGELVLLKEGGDWKVHMPKE